MRCSAATLIFLAFNRKHLKSIVAVSVVTGLLLFQTMQEQVPFFNYFLKAVDQLLSGVQTTRAGYIVESYNSIEVLPNRDYAHPFDNTIATLFVSAGLLGLPYIILVLASLIAICRVSLFLGASFFVLIMLNDQHLEFSFWVIVILALRFFLFRLKLRQDGATAVRANDLPRI
jgi:hypothetical protein